MMKFTMINASSSASSFARAVLVLRQQAAMTTSKQLRYKSATTVEHISSNGGISSSAKAANHNQSSTTSSGVPIVQSLLAAVLGCGTVSAVAALIENGTASSVVAFDPNGQRYDQSNFMGRFARMLLACDPRLILYTEKEVRQAQEMVQQYQELPPSMDRQLWEAKRIADAAIHPDTNEIIPRPFRMSGYVPYNGPICVAMVASQSTMPLLFWSWVNQSQNALVNYYNRNASSPMTNETLATSYGAAVGSALLVAFGLATAIQKKFQPAQARHLLRWVAFPSAVVASSLNCYIVRSPEISTGIPLQDEHGRNVLPDVTSTAAATRAVHETTLSRALLQAPVYFVPPLLLSVGPLRRYVSHHPAMAVPATTFLLMVCFGIGLPATVAVFPQISQIQANQVEAPFQQLHNPSTQEPYRAFYYNKGL